MNAFNKIFKCCLGASLSNEQISLSLEFTDVKIDHRKSYSMEVITSNTYNNTIYNHTFDVLNKLKESNQDTKSRISFDSGKRLKFDINGQLEELYIDNCTIDNIPIQFGLLTNIVSIWMSNNNISMLPETITSLINLKHLWLNNNNFDSVPYLPKNIECLYMFNNPIVTLIRIGTCVNLVKLYINDCELQSLCEEITELKQLQILECHCNELIELPSYIGELTNLKHVSLHSNFLKTLPKEIGELNQLNWLSLHFNELSRLPPEFGKLKNLTRLSLHWNKLENLPKEFGNCKALQVVSLFNNYLVTIPDEVYMNLQNCIKLSLHNNHIDIVSPLIKNMISLEDIWLWGNKFLELPNELIELPNIKNIYLCEKNNEHFNFNNIRENNKNIAIV